MSSGLSATPHRSSRCRAPLRPLTPTRWPLVFVTQLVEGRVPESSNVFDNLAAGPLTIDRTHTGVVHNLMPVRNGGFGYNLSQ